MYVHLLLPGGRGSSHRLRRQRWAAQHPRIASDAPRVYVSAAGSRLIAGSRISRSDPYITEKNTIFLWEAACRRCSRRGISGKSRHRSSSASRLPRSVFASRQRDVEDAV